MTDTEARTVITAVLQRIAPELDLARFDFDPTAPLAGELELDSMDVLAMLAGIGEETGVQIPDADVDPEWSLDDLAAYLSSR
ncbi:MAG: acyl carrier protein [Acidimicrobiales bacterium]